MRFSAYFLLLVVSICLFMGIQVVAAQESVTLSLRHVDDMALSADGSYALAWSTNEAQSTGVMTTANLIPGKWEVIWEGKVSTCKEFETTSNNRPFMMVTDVANDTFSTEDLFVWSLYNFVYQINADGQYTFLRNQSYNDGTILSFEYITKIVSPTRIEGTRSTYSTRFTCTDRDSFVLALVDEHIVCMVGSDREPNVRSGPGTRFTRLGTLAKDVPVDVIGQRTGAGNLRWWKLSDGSWVREDVVTEAGSCDTVPEAQP